MSGCEHSWLVARLRESGGRWWATYQCEHCGELLDEMPPREVSWIARALTLLGAALVAVALWWLWTV